MRLLVIEDDAAIRSVLQRGLDAEGFEVDVADNGDDGLWKALEGGYSAIILDLLLPGRSGYAVCGALRAEGDSTPILVLTAKSGEFDQIDLLDAGADDFLTKPVSIAVLAARLRVLIRRAAALPVNRIERGDLEYDLATRECRVAGTSVDLTSREDQVLRNLLLAGSGCISRNELFEAVWGPDSGLDATNLDIHLRRLRNKIAPMTIENVRGVGYRIVGR